MKKYLVYLQNAASEKEHNYSRVSGTSSDAKMIYVETEDDTDPDNLAFTHISDDDDYDNWFIVKVEQLSNYP